uniref:Uncharacterized protein n=1 Tax=Megaselia scalaris TaxID=36166 RepID=T1GJK4_MEGSC
MNLVKLASAGDIPLKIKSTISFATFAMLPVFSTLEH